MAVELKASILIDVGMTGSAAQYIIGLNDNNTSNQPGHFSMPRLTYSQASEQASVEGRQKMFTHVEAAVQAILADNTTVYPPSIPSAIVHNFRHAPIPLWEFHVAYPALPGPPKNLQYWLDCAEQDIWPEAKPDDNQE
ncbi:uncharacterized protein BP5553_10070 [Venustampulla echinocandica]|uniref:Uncharacterized protein n=1 Tax=Venustampulla echinocandica TaxID=2656787 RepID=A0A370TAA3_9HELO|nr:uncharacterized protein BP5553_10070 [Venustampulla echinocandica]RDL30725.1 hypothetical protein BP5553_10070 [Venustampulla echinocandica]